jgi:hypothetical protein
MPARLGAAPALRRAGADKIALNVGEAAKDGNHQAPGAGGGVGPQLGQRAELPARIDDALDDGEKVEGRAGEAIYPRGNRESVLRGDFAGLDGDPSVRPASGGERPHVDNAVVDCNARRYC